MAKGKRKRGNDAKLRVISGGAAPKAVVTKRPPVATPVSAPKATPPNLRRDVAAKAVREPESGAVEASNDDVSVARPLPKQNAIPRAAIFAALVIAVGFAAWALTRNSMNAPPAAPVASTPTVEWTPTSAPNIAPLPIVTASVTASASPSAEVEPSVSASAPVPVPVPVPAASSSTAPPPPTVVEPKPAAPPPPPVVAPKPAAPTPPPPPKPAEDNPYQ